MISHSASGLGSPQRKQGMPCLRCGLLYRRRGAILVEFSLIALLLFFLLAMTLDFGRAVYSAQSVQQAADFIGRELSHTPLPPAPTLTVPTNPLADPAFAPLVKAVYSEDFLVIDVTTWLAGGTGQTLLDFLDTRDPPLPTGNKLLVPLMILMTHAQNDNVPAGSTWLMYPGALVPSSSGTSPTGFTVQIPTVPSGSGTPNPQGQWLPVVELDAKVFPISSPQMGLISLRVNFPFQAAALTGSTGAAVGPSYIQVPAGEDLMPGQVGGPYSGPTGLGQQAAFTKTVRPFRRVLSAQAVYRREVFSP